MFPRVVQHKNTRKHRTSKTLIPTSLFFSPLYIAIYLTLPISLAWFFCFFALSFFSFFYFSFPNILTNFLIATIPMDALTRGHQCEPPEEAAIVDEVEKKSITHGQLTTPTALA
jgi:hypothetical protein